MKASTPIAIDQLFSDELKNAWLRRDSGQPGPDLPEPISYAVSGIVRSSSAPARQILLAIAAGTAFDSTSNPRSLQLAAGVDRRGQALSLVPALSDFVHSHGLTLKISKDPGVSNPFREVEINEVWVEGRGSGAIYQHLLSVVEWLEGAGADDSRAERALDLLAASLDELIEYALANVLVYPIFPAAAPTALALADDFLVRVGHDPDALEAVVTAAARAVGKQLDGKPTVERGDTNAPDPIDILIRDVDGNATGGIEVTKDAISVAKLQHEVLPAMQLHGLKRATVICKPPAPMEEKSVSAFVHSTAIHLGQFIELRGLEDLESWLTLPGLSADTASDFLVEIGIELDQYSSDPLRHAWRETLTEFIARSTETHPS